MMRFVFAAALLLALGPAVRAQDPEKKDELRISGKLSPDDPKDKKIQQPSKRFPFALAADTVYVIDLKSPQFDTYLRLEDPAGKQVAEDDDGGGGLNSRIVYKTAKGGPHTIIVTTFDGKTGDFELTARQGTSKDLVKADPFQAMIGKPAPNITATFSFNGKTKSLTDLKGKVVLVDFWAVWCGPCIQTFPHLRELAKEHQKEGLEILGVTTYFQSFAFDKEKGKLTQAQRKVKDETTGEFKLEGSKLTPAQEHEMLKDFVAHHKLGHRMITVTQKDWSLLGKDYSIRGIPHVTLIDRQGNVRMVRVGSGPANANAISEEIKKLLAEK